MFYRKERKLLPGAKLVCTHSSATVFWGAGYYLGFGYRTLYFILGHREITLQLSGGKPVPMRGYKANLEGYFGGP